MLSRLWRLATLCLSVSLATHVGWAQDATADANADSPVEEKANDEPPPEPKTTSDPEVPVDQLALLLKPLTKDQLVVEADGWQGLLQNKLLEISQMQIDLLKQKESEQSTESAEETASRETASEPAASADAEANDPDAVAQAADTLVDLQEERTHLVDRNNVVIDSLEAKGGDVESYRKYISSSTGIDFKASDASTTWALLLGWLNSEQGGRRWMWNIIKFLAILAAFYFGASLISRLVRHAVARIKGSSQLLVNFSGASVKKLLLVIGFVVALSALEVNIAPLLAAIGAAGFVIGLALQGTLGNFASGLLILFYRPFDVGDVIDAGGVSGIVDSVSLVSTHIRTFDNKMMIVPNNDIWGGTITNASASETRRVDMVFGIGYDDDVDIAKGILERIVNDHPLVLEDPAPVIQLNELGDSSVNFICRPWAKNSDFWKVYWDITRSVKQEFDRTGISIPFPQRDVHLHHHGDLATPQAS